MIGLYNDMIGLYKMIRLDYRMTVFHHGIGQSGTINDMIGLYTMTQYDYRIAPCHNNYDHKRALLDYRMI